MRIGLDIDDVLYPFATCAHRASIAAGIANGHVPTSWAPFKEYGCTIDEWHAALAEATISGQLYGGSPFPGVRRDLRRLHEAGHTIHLATARGYLQHGDLIRAQTAEWLEDHRLEHDSLTFTQDKTVVHVDVFADDHPGNCRALNEAGIATWMVDANHNADDPYPWRVQHLGAFVDLILSLDTPEAAA